MLRPVCVAEQGVGAAVSLRTFVEALAEGRSMAANTPLLAGRGGAPVPTPAGRAAVRAAVALAVLAACVCAALLAFPSSPAAPAELYLPLAVPAWAPPARGHARLGVEGSTLLAAMPSMSSSVLGARKEQVEEDDGAEAGAGAANDDGESDADRVRDQLGVQEDDARATSSFEGSDEDTEEGPHGDLAPADANDDTESGDEGDEGGDEYVEDIDVTAGHLLASSRGRGGPLTSLKKGSNTHSTPKKIEIKPYDPSATVGLTPGSWHHTHCRHEGRLEHLKSQSGPTCHSYEALTDWKMVNCGHGRMKTMYRCASHGHSIGGGSHFYRTSCQSSWLKHSEYLDRQHVRCPEGSVLSYFQYTSSGCWWWKGRYEFRCT
jgi:hypothetical protein